MDAGGSRSHDVIVADRRKSEETATSAVGSPRPPDETAQKRSSVAAVYDRRGSVVAEFERKNLPGEQPVFGILHQTSAYRIVAYVFPFR